MCLFAKKIKIYFDKKTLKDSKLRNWMKSGKQRKNQKCGLTRRCKSSNESRRVQFSSCGHDQERSSIMALLDIKSDAKLLRMKDETNKKRKESGKRKRSFCKKTTGDAIMKSNSCDVRTSK